MASVGHSRARALTARYLDPRRPWTGADAAALRAHLAACDPCRAAYDEAVCAHRALVGGDPAVPSGFEARRQLDALLGPAPDAAPPLLWRWLRPGAYALTAALVALAVPFGPWWPAEPPPQPRGAASAAPVAGLGVSGVDQHGREYEVLASAGAHRGDWLRFSYSIDAAAPAAPTHLFVFGLQPGAPPLWYAPMPPDEAASLPVAPGRFVALPFESRLSPRHADGPLTVVALFTRRPLTLDQVAAALPDPAPALGAAPPAAVAALLRHGLDLGPDAVVQLLPTRVLPPSTSPDASEVAP